MTHLINLPFRFLSALVDQLSCQLNLPNQKSSFQIAINLSIKMITEFVESGWEITEKSRTCLKNEWNYYCHAILSQNTVSHCVRTSTSFRFFVKLFWIPQSIEKLEYFNGIQKKLTARESSTNRNNNSIRYFGSSYFTQFSGLWTVRLISTDLKTQAEN